MTVYVVGIEVGIQKTRISKYNTAPLNTRAAITVYPVTGRHQYYGAISASPSARSYRKTLVLQKSLKIKKFSNNYEIKLSTFL
jgi:hypothetical protein